MLFDEDSTAAFDSHNLLFGTPVLANGKHVQYDMGFRVHGDTEFVLGFNR